MTRKLLHSALSLMLCLAMLLSLCPMALAESNDSALTVGTTIHGFTVKENGHFALLNADTILLEHDKTGALVYFLLNEDTNRAFDISFVTPLSNDKGIPHVFEHSTLNGSKKYPSTSLFFNLSYQTYNTYMNASTYQVMTTYPVASLSEAQLLKYADFYLDSCFNPMIYEDETIFDSEAWRYSLESADAPLTISGTVYSEMQGAASLSRTASNNAMRVAFPHANMGYNQGGEPSEIPSMTWQEVKDYHTAYYHPSNSLTTIYGKVEDPAAFLALMDTFFSTYEKKEFVFDTPDYTPVVDSIERVFEYPVYADTSADHTGETYVVFLCGDATEEEINALDLLTSLLDDTSSPLIGNLTAVLPTVDVTTYLETMGPEPAVVFVASGMNAEDATLLRDCIYTSMRQFMSTPVSDELLDGIAASLSIETALMGESSDLGVNMAQNIAYYWAVENDVHAYEKVIENLNNFQKYQDEGLYNQLVAKYLTEDNPRVVTVTTVAAPGQKEVEEAALAQKLADVKAGMTEEEINEIVERTAALAAGSTDDASAYVAQLQAVTVDSLPEEVRVYDYTDVTDERGIRFVDVQADVDNIGQTYVLLDASGITKEDLHWFNLYTQLVGSVDTKQHEVATISALTNRYLYDGRVKIAVLDTDTPSGFTPYLRMSWNAMDEDMAGSYDLMHEILFESDFTDTVVISAILSSMRLSMQQDFNENAYSYLLNRAYCRTEPGYNLYFYATGFEFYDFLADAQALLESDPDAFAAKLNGIASMLCNSTNAIFGFAGNEASIANHRTAAEGFIATLGTSEIVPQTYDLPIPAASEGLVIDSSVNYNMVYATYEQMGIEGGYNGGMDALCALVTDGLLYPLLRDQYGAYSVFHGASMDGVYIITYRDPNVAQSFNVMSYVPQLLTQLQMMLDQDTLNGYILSCYSYYALSTGELTGAATIIPDIIEGVDPYLKLQWMHDLKEFKIEDIPTFATLYQALLENGYMATAGSQATLNAQPTGTYENIIKP